MAIPNPLEITGLDHVVLRVRDLDAALGFYRDVLGLPIERQLDIGLVQLRAGRALIDLVPVDRRDRPQHGSLRADAGALR
jgi:glyoxylase I family protein